MKIAEPWEEGPSLAASLWRYKLVVLLGLLLGGVLGYAGALGQPTVYEAGGELIMESSTGVLITDADTPRRNPQRDLRNRVEQLTSARVLEAASQEMGGSPSAGAIDDALDVGYSDDLDVITMVAAAGDAQLAADIVNAVGAAFLAISSQDAAADAASQVAQIESAITRTDDRVGALEAQLAAAPDSVALTAQRNAAVAELIDLSSRAQRLAVVQELPPSGVRSFEQALPPRSPSQPRPRISAALGAALGLALAGAFAYWRAGHVMAVTDAGRAASVLGLPLLGVIPEFSSSQVRIWWRWLRPRRTEEPYRLLAVPIISACRDLGGAVLAVTSAHPDDGKTQVAEGVAAAAAHEGLGVTLVDADPAKWTLTRSRDLVDRPGLTDLVRGEATYSEAWQLVDAGGAGALHVLPIGRSLGRIGGLLDGRPLDAVIPAPRGVNELVIVDCGDVVAQSDAIHLSTQADAVIVVVRSGTRVSDLERLRERIAWGQARVLGLVFNRDRSRPFSRRTVPLGRQRALRPAQKVAT